MDPTTHLFWITSRAAGTAALLYARDLARGYVSGALGGLVIGAACGLAASGCCAATAA